MVGSKLLQGSAAWTAEKRSTFPWIERQAVNDFVGGQGPAGSCLAAVEVLDWAEERNRIHSQVHAIAMKEIGRRIESKTRPRRVRSQGDIMSTFKKGMSSGGKVNLGQLNNKSPWRGGGGIAF